MSVFDELQKYGSVQDLQTGQEKPLSKLPFRYIGLYFTATWCSYCVKIADTIRPLLDKINQKGSFFRLITMRLDDDPTNFGYYDLRLRGVSQREGEQMARWANITKIPSIVVYDYLGRLVTTNGYSDMSRFKERTIELWDRKMEL